MLYKNSPIGELQERRHNEDQARSFNAVDTKATKIDILETKFFGNNTIPREENYPIIEEATTADPNTIRDEILPSDKVVLKPETNMEWRDYNITSPVRYEAKVDDDPGLVCTWDEDSMGVGSLSSYHTKQAFVTIMGRILDTHSNVDKTDLNKSYVASSLGSTMTVKMEAIIVAFVEREIIVPCIPVYGKLRSDPYILDLARGGVFYDNVNTQPFPSITFPIITFTDRDPASAEFYRFPHSSHLTGNEDDFHILKSYGICKVSSSSHPGVESQAAVHAGLIKIVDQDDDFINNKRIIDGNDTESTIITLEQNEDISVSRELVYTPKIYSSVNSVRKNVAIVKEATGDMFNHDGLGMQCRVFKSLNCLAHTISQNANKIDVSIVYQTQLISTSNSKSETDEDEYFAEGESVYALIPVSMKIRQYNTDDNSFDHTVSVTPSSRGDLCWHDPDRSFISKKRKTEPSLHYEYNTQFDTIDKKITIYSDNNHEIRGYKLNLYSYNNNELIINNEGDEYMYSKIVFTYFNKITQQEFSPAYYNFPQFSNLDINTFIITDIKVDDQGEEKLFVISYKINNQEYRTTLTCIPFESYYSIGSLIGATGLKKHMFINADSINISEPNNDLSVIAEHKNEEQSPSKIVTDNKYQVTLGGLNNFRDSTIYLSSAPYSYFKLAMYQLNKEDREVPTVWDKLSGSHNVMFTKSLTQENQPYAIPYRTKYSPAVFVWGNSFHAWKTNDFKVSHASGIFRQLMLPSYRTRGHAEYQDVVPLYTEAIALPMILPILQPMRNSDNHTVVKHGMYRYTDTEINGSDNTVKRLLLIRNPEKNNYTGNEYLNSMRGSFLGRCLNNQTDILYAYETPTDYAAFNVHLLNIDKLSVSTDDTYRSSYCNAYRKLSQSNVYQGKYNSNFELSSYILPRSEFYQGFVGTIMVYPTKQLNQTGQYTDMDTVTQYNGMDFSHYNIIRGDKLVNVNNKSYLLHNEQFYPASLLYKYTSTSKQSVQINSLSGAGVIKLHTVGAYLFMVKETHSEVYYQDENDIIPLFADSGTIIDSPVISGMDIFFCILSTDKTQIKVYSINRLDIVKRGIIYSSSEVKNSIVFWSSKVKYPSILYTEMGENNAIKIIFKSIFPAGVVSMGDLPTISGRNISDLLIRTKTINGAVGEPEFLISVGDELIIASLDTKENEKQSMKIKSSVITLPEYQENMFILTGIEVSVIQYKSVRDNEKEEPLRTLKINIYNAFNSESIKEKSFTGNNIASPYKREIDVVHGKVLLSVSPDMDIRRIYYTIESEGYKITGVNLVGYFTELI